MMPTRFFFYALLCILPGCSREKTAERHHLLLITIDTLRADHVGAYGDPAARTPVLDGVAREGVRFEKAIAAAPLTLPSHATILTGLLPPQHGLRNNGAGKLAGDTPTLATELSAAGYRTGAFVGAFVLDRRFGLNRGFDVYDDDIPAARSENARLEAERPASLVMDRAVEWIRRPDQRPMFAWIHLYDPHAPYDPPDPFRSSFPGDPYRGEVAWVDSQVGRVLDELARQKIQNRTVVVIAGDHGEALGDHGEGTHGLLLYEPTLRVPLLVRAPEVLKPGVISRTVSLADLAPTLQTLLGGGFGVRRLGAAFDQDKEAKAAASRRTPKPPNLFDESDDRVIYAETEYPTLFGWSALASTRRGDWKFIESPSPEFYELSRDPGETRNLYGQQRRTMNTLAAAVGNIRGSATQSPPTPLDPETERKLASLGYVTPAPVERRPPTAAGANPVERIRLFRRFEQATWDLFGGRPTQAIAELEQLVRDDPENPIFRSSLARAHRQHGRMQRAIELYRDAVALRPDDAEGWYNLAAVFQDSGDQARAAEAVREAIRRDPSRPEAHNVLGITYSAEGKFTEALEQFTRAASLDPRNARAFNNSGNVYRSMQRVGEAEKAYRRAIELDPSYSDPWNGLGTLEIERGKPNQAVQFFERALVLSPDAHEARLNRAVALQLSGDLRAAAREYRIFIDAVDGLPAFVSQQRAARAMLSRISSTLPPS